MMPSGFIGSLVSIDCGQLGTYQGRVENIDPVMNTLTISHAFHNGLSSDQPKVNLSSTTILDIKIIHAFHEAEEILTRKATPSKMTREIDEVTRQICSSPVKIIKAASKTRQATSSSGVNHLDLAYGKSNYCHNLSPNNSPSKLCSSGPESMGRRPRISKSANREPSTNVKTKQGSEDQQHQEQSRLASGNSAECHDRKKSAEYYNCKYSAEYHDGKALSVKKGDRGGVKGASVKNNECFTAPMNSILQEFDFESNLALFNKKAVFQEIENGGHEPSFDSNSSERRYRHDENILQPGDNGNVTRKQQIEVPDHSCQLYYTDSGLVVPSISLELREKVCAAAAQSGLTDTRQLEAFGRGASEMAIHLIGGSHRIHPKNGHQMPVVVVLCGLHETGAMGACCARMLSTHGVQVTVLMENATLVPLNLKQEIDLYKLTGSRLVHDVRDLPSTIDLIVAALDSPVNPVYNQQPWYQNITKWIMNSDVRAQVLAIDPPPKTADIAAKWSLCKVLPLNEMSSSCGSLYLCDLSIPSAIFKKSGIKYVSPFGSKFVIPLYGHE